MKKFIYLFLAMMAPAVFSSCNDDDDITVVTSPTASGSVTDNEGNVYEWIRIGDLEWTTTNAKNGTRIYDYTYYNNFRYAYVDIKYGSEYEDEFDYIDNGYMPVYGNLMCYNEAVASAPEGWRLPTDEDWKALERALGMTDADNKGWRGTNGVASRLMATSDSGVGMGLKLGGGTVRVKSYGWMAMNLNTVTEYGYFWTSTPDNSYGEVPMAYFRKLVAGVDGVERQCSHTDNLMSVRWCRNATN